MNRLLHRRLLLSLADTDRGTTVAGYSEWLRKTIAQIDASPRVLSCPGTNRLDRIPEDRRDLMHSGRAAAAGAATP